MPLATSTNFSGQPLKNQAPDFCAWTWLTPDDDPLPSLLELLAGAKESILIFAYGFTLPCVVDELVAAMASGVDVRIIMDSSQAGGKAQRVQVARLKDAGVPIKIGRSRRGGIIHMKMAIVDRVCLWTGSWNWSASASFQNNDAALLFLPAGLGHSRRREMFEREWERLSARSKAA